jgi:hypothetical protein
MKNITSSMTQTAAGALAAGLGMAAILLMGSESPWFPWPNLAGLIILLIVAILARRYDKRFSQFTPARPRGGSIGHSYR